MKTETHVRKIESLVRRKTFLEHRVSLSDGYTWDLAELQALSWAIDELCALHLITNINFERATKNIKFTKEVK